MGRNTMTFLQKREIVSASMKVFAAIQELQYVMRNSGNNTKECIRVGKLDYAARSNVRYWIDRPVLELSTEQNRNTADYLDVLWKACQKENNKPWVDEANDGTSI
jgi:hypothetical protein